jgi:hypothetical protein
VPDCPTLCGDDDHIHVELPCCERSLQSSATRRFGDSYDNALACRRDSDETASGKPEAVQFSGQLILLAFFFCT